MADEPAINRIIQHMIDHHKVWDELMRDSNVTSIFTTAYDLAFTQRGGESMVFTVRQLLNRAGCKIDAHPVPYGVIAALITWPDFEYVISSTPEQVHLLSILGNPAATLLYSAVLAIDATKELA